MRKRHILIAVLGCLGAALVACNHNPESPVKELQEQAQKWWDLSQEEIENLWAMEYKTVRAEPSDLNILDERLNELGRQRWDCYHVGEDREGRIFYFKRRKARLLRYVPLSALF